MDGRIRDPRGQRSTAPDVDICDSPKSTFLIKLLISGTCLLSILPGLLTKLLVGARQQLVGQPVVLPPVAAVAQYAAAAIVILTCFVMISAHVRRWRELHGAGVLSAILGLWLYISINDLTFGIKVTLSSIIFPLTALAVWISQSPAGVIRVLGYFGGVAAALSLLIGLFLPKVGLYVDSLGGTPDSDKGIVPGPALAGIFTSTNNLGQFLCLCLPAAFLIRSRLARYSSILVIVAAVSWSGSRSSLAAIAVVMSMMAFRSVLKNRGKSFTTLQRICVSVSVICCVVTPFAIGQDSDAFSGRGRIWRVSLAAWEARPLQGLGSQWFIRAAGMQSGFGSRSEYLVFHGHNQVLQLLVTGGILSVSLFGVVSFVLWRRSGVGLYGWFVSTYVVAFFVSGTLELNLGIVDRFQFYSTALVPLLIIVCQPVVKYEARSRRKATHSRALDGGDHARAA